MVSPQPDNQQIMAMTKVVRYYAVRARHRLRSINRSPQDAIQEVLMECCRHWRRYDPKRGSVASWSKGIAKRRIRDILRDGTRQKRYIDPRHFEDLETVEIRDELQDAVEEVVTVPDEVLAERLMAAGTKYRRKGHDYNPDSVPPLTRAAVCVLMARTMLGCRAMAMYLRSRPDLCRILNLRMAPSHESIRQWVKRCRVFAGIRQTLAENRRICRVPAETQESAIYA
jgi:RNA polymerase sigma factor (sigma-70 family)